jgi:hypothetical protein
MRYFITICLFIISISLFAQENHLGLRIGLNTSHLDGTLEDNASYSSLPGFHIGPTFSLGFSDIMGLRGELLFSQKGAKFAYSGPSYLTIKKNLEYIPTVGTRTMSIAVNNNYLDIPLMFYVLLFEHLDISVGGYASVLVGSSAKGDLLYSGKRENSNATIGPLKYLIDGNYLRDRAGSVSSSLTQTIKLEGDQITLPQNIGGYFEYKTKPDGRKYNTLDYGLTGALHYRLNRGLYVGVRYQLGLSDVSNDDFDISYKSLSPSKEFNLVPVVNKHRGLQFSIMLQL